MKKILILILVVMMLACIVAGCSKQGDDTTTTTAGTTVSGENNATTDNADTDTSKATTAVNTNTGATQAKPDNADMFEFSKYGYHIYHPKGFEILNNEGNMIEFMNEAGVDFTVLVLENKYDSLTDMLNSQMEEEEEIIRQGANFFLVRSEGNGRTNYIYYYYGKDMVRCELSYEDSQKEAMKGLEEQIMVEAHSH